ncbi:MAG: small ribosomal subunit Rsm22 family protein [bacterium]
MPGEISEKILDILDMPGLDESTKSSYRQRLQAIRKDMKRLAADFAAYKSTEAHYTDAYLLYNFPANLAKTAVVVENVGLHYPDLFRGRKRLSILDIGCGNGAGICGTYYALRFLPGIQQFNFMGIDRSRTMLGQGRVVAQWLRKRDPRVRVYFRKSKFGDFHPLALKKKYDFILCINSLAEIIEEEDIPLRFISSTFRHLVDGGLFIIIEPALKKFSRRLMRLRDRLVSNKRIQLLLPCLHDSPCALLEVDSRKEWCHQTVPWSPPEFLRIINQGINREIDVLKFSYLVIARSAKRLKRPSGHLVISHLLKEKGKQRCYICTPEGRAELVRLNKARSEANAGFDKISKGVIVNLTDVVHKKGDYWQIAKGSTVKVVE